MSEHVKEGDSMSEFDAHDDAPGEGTLGEASDRLPGETDQADLPGVAGSELAINLELELHETTNVSGPNPHEVEIGSPLDLGATPTADSTGPTETTIGAPFEDTLPDLNPHEVQIGGPLELGAMPTADPTETSIGAPLDDTVADPTPHEVDIGSPYTVTDIGPTLNEQLGLPDAPVTTDSPAPGIHGHEEGQFWQDQKINGYCGPASVAMIVEEFTHHHYTAEQIVDLARRENMYIDDPTHPGMPVADLPKLLLDASDGQIPSHLVHNATLADLETALDQQRDVVMYVDGPKIWNAISNGAVMPDPEKGDHLLVVTEINENEGYAILNDTGSPDGRDERVPLDVLESAWAKGGHEMIVTGQAPAAEMRADTPEPTAAAPISEPPVPSEDRETAPISERPAPSEEGISVPGAPMKPVKLVKLLPVLVPATVLLVRKARGRHT
jgi:hypothetical protein